MTTESRSFGRGAAPTGPLGRIIATSSGTGPTTTLAWVWAPAPELLGAARITALA